MRIPHSAYKIMPWKNGLGTTAEIDRMPAGAEHYIWRLSQASIQADSEFSTFKGYDRWLAVWQGNSIFLNDVEVCTHTPVRFSGDAKTLCRLAGGPIQDVGLIFDRTKVEAEMKLVEGPIKLPHAQTHYIFDIKSGDTLKYEHATELLVARSFLISVWPLRGLA